MARSAPTLLRLLVALVLASVSSVLLGACGSGSDEGTVGFGAARIALTSGGTPFVAGVRGRCGELVIARVGAGRPRQVRVSGDELGGDCVERVTAMAGSRAGVDVTAEVHVPSDSSLEDTSGTNSALVRVTPAGERDGDFGQDGIVDDNVSSSTTTLPDGRAFGAAGSSLLPTGKALPVRFLPVDLVPGESVITAGPDGRLLVAGQPRFATRDHVEVVKATPDLRLDQGFGKGGVARLPYGFPTRIEPLPDGGAMVLGNDGALAAVDGRGRPQRALFLPAGRVLAIAGGARGVALAGRDSVVVVRPGSSAPTTIPSPTGSVADLALAPAGRLLVLGGGRVTVFDLDRKGRRVASWPVS